MKNSRKKYGVTLLETIISIGFVGAASGAYISHEMEEAKKEAAYDFLLNSKSVIEAVDKRLSIDGYDALLWNQLQWSSNSEIKNELIKKSLISASSSSCSGGEWNPSIASEQDASLLSCRLFDHIEDTDQYLMDANITQDSVGFIQSFDLNIKFKDNDSFSDNFGNLKVALNKINVQSKKEISGSHFYELYSQNTNDVVSVSECLLEGANCFLKLSFERSGGGEYILASGQNSMIGEHLTFIESRGQAPMKCIRWKNTLDDGSGTWSQTIDEDCGIGIYNDLNHPAVVDVVAETGSFEHVLLDQECNLYQLDLSNNVVVSGQTPCGMINGSEAIQVIDNIHASTILAETGNFNVSNTDKLIATEISTKTLTVSGLSTFYNLEINGNLDINGSVTSVTEVVGNNTFKAPVGDFDNINVEISNLKNSINSLNSNISAALSPWYTTGWGSCNVSCGNGTKSRSVYCPANKICQGNKPSTTQSCYAGSCWTGGGGHGANSGAGGGEGG